VGLSIRWKLFLFIGGLVTLVALAFGGAAYQAVRQSSLSATTQHLTSIAGQWARLFGDGTARQSAAFRAVAGHALVQEALARRGESALAAAETALRPLLPAGQVSSLQLLDRDRAPLLMLGDTASAVRAPVHPALLDAAAAQNSLAVGPIRAVGRAVVGSYARRITVDGAVAGYVTQTTQVKITPSPDEINALFGGTATRVRLANRDGSVWTDLAEPVPAPSPPVVLSEGLLSYDTPAAGPAFASAVPIAGTPWMVVMETDKAQVLADSRRVLLRLLLGGGIAVAAGMLVAIAMSASLTRPVAHLTASAEAIAAGDYTHLSGVQPRRDELGRLAQAFDTMVTRVQEAFAARRDAEDYYRALFESIPLPTWVFDPESRAILAVNDAAVRHYGYQPDEFLAMTVSGVEAGESRHRKKDGTLIDVEVHTTTMMFQDRPVRLAVIHDRTELIRAERHSRQAQKMEAIGQLAGGIAHDFNNLLTVILAYCELLRSRPGMAASDREGLDAIHDAGTSAAALTRQLLMFSRREVVQPRVMRLNDSIAGTGKMLERLLGEQVELATALAPDVGAVRIDPGQLEQVIVNLAVNARDAMPGGGRLMIESRNLDVEVPGADGAPLIPAGGYVLLVVSDNGSGMDAETQSRIFEPFFTTKVHGKGTGLGLATVYGIVKQNGGHITVYSEPGHGTSFKIYFPRLDESAAEPRKPADSTEPPTGTETILLVEDERSLRELACRILEPSGYRVLTAANGEAAQAIVMSHPGPIHLLVTDVVLPGMTGSAVAAWVTRQRPGIPVLFMSGYTDDAIVHHGVLEAGMHFIEKPFTGTGLSRKVRQVLDALPKLDA
jgi:two-component system cell cycle sensor histidine kinase/response regulator CckA